jgi:hypothetical protein
MLSLVPLFLASCTIQIEPSGGAATGPGISTPVHVEHSLDGSTLVLIDVTIGGKGPFSFAVDTGASTSLVDQSIARQTHLHAVGGPSPISGVGGVTQETPVAVNQWHIGTIRLPKATIGSADLSGTTRDAGVNGLLGSDILSQFGTITLNYSAGTLTVYKQIAVAVDGA